MGSMLGDLPSYDPHNFSQLRPSDPSTPSKMIPATYHPTHSRTLPPPDQVINTEAKIYLYDTFISIQKRSQEQRDLQPSIRCLSTEASNQEHLLPTLQIELRRTFSSNNVKSVLYCERCVPV